MNPAPTKASICLAETSSQIITETHKYTFFADVKDVFLWDSENIITTGITNGIREGGSLHMDVVSIEKQKEIYRKIIKKVVEIKTNILLFPEMNFPYDSYSQDDPNEEFFQELQSFSNNNNLIIIAGSYHAKRRNTCPIFFPNTIKYSQDKVNPSKEEQEHRSIENVERVINCFETEDSRIFILICSDLYSEDIRKKINYYLKKKVQSTKHNFFFIPAYDFNRKKGGLYKKGI